MSPVWNVHVTVSRAGDGFALSVDGRLHQVDFARIDAHTLSLIVDTSFSAGPQSVYETTIVSDADGRQLGFWGGDQAAHDRADRALARVQGMLGYDAVVTAVIQGGRTPVDESTIYRLLHRHGWRKLVPRPRHPKAHAEKQATFKKPSQQASRRQ